MGDTADDDLVQETGGADRTSGLIHRGQGHFAACAIDQLRQQGGALEHLSLAIDMAVVQFEFLVLTELDAECDETPVENR